MILKFQIKSLALMISIATISGCGLSSKEVADPSELTVSAAMADIGRGFSELEQNKSRQLGLYPCKVTVNLNVTASATDNSKLVIDRNMSPVGQTIGTATTTNANLELGNTSTGSRGNTIAVELINPVCLPKGTLGADNPGKVKDLVGPLGSLVVQAPFGFPPSQ